MIRSRSSALLLGLSCSLLVVSCVPLKPFRTQTIETDAAGRWAGDLVCEVAAGASKPGDCAVEHRRYEPPDPVEGEKLPDYYFATVEFDDQGWFWDRKQMEALLRLLYENQDEEYLIFAHAHGWQHNAKPCDNNVVCLQRFLERMDLTEKSLTDQSKRDRPRKVVGVYISWRGRSVSIPKVAATTFWSRKRAGARVGIGGVTELLTRLDDYRRFRNPRRSAQKTQLVISGHSFGGQVVYKALAHSLIERAVAMSKPRQAELDANPDVPGFRYEVARSFGDLVVLVNPAFEGSAYESLHHAATNRCYPAQQRPVMLVVTSEADDATGKAFPIGRTLSTLFSRTSSPAQRRAVRHTVGHSEKRYQSHSLKLKAPPGRAMAAPKKNDEGACGCPYLDPTNTFRRLDQDREFLRMLDQTSRARADAKSADSVYEVGNTYDDLASFNVSSYGKDRDGFEMLLEREQSYAANYPYLVIQTDKFYIPDHSSIYGERFVDFLRRFFVRHIADRVNFPEQCFEAEPTCHPTDITPCQRSWTGEKQ